MIGHPVPQLISMAHKAWLHKALLMHQLRYQHYLIAGAKFWNMRILRHSASIAWVKAIICNNNYPHQCFIKESVASQLRTPSMLAMSQRPAKT